MSENAMHTQRDLAGLNNVDRLKALLRKGEYVNSKKGDYKPLIHVAAEKGCNEVLKLLIESGADVNRLKHGSERTPLFFAKNEEIATILVKAGADLNAKDLANQTALFTAVQNNKLPLVKFLVESCGSEVDARDKLGFTPLHAACSYRKNGFNIEIVRFLLRKNAKIDNIAYDSYRHRGPTPIATLLYQSRQAAAIDPEFYPFLKFLLKYSDVTNLNFGSYISGIVSSIDNNTCFIFLEHVSVLISLSFVILSHENFISKSQDYKDHFNKCQNELLIAKSTKLRDSWVTFFNILTDSRKKLKNYAGNEDLVNDFNNTDFNNKFPIYGARMQEKMNKGIKRREIYDRSCNFLSGLLLIFNPNHLVVRDTLDCVLSTKDLSKFCE